MRINNILVFIGDRNIQYKNFKGLGGLNDNNQKDGYWEKYYENGQLHSKGNYVNGLFDGYWEVYYDNGILRYKGNYINGFKVGYWEFYYYNGQLVSRKKYVNGVKDGYWKRFLNKIYNFFIK